MAAAGGRPVGDDDVAVGLGRDGPELVAEAEVVTDEQADPGPLHVDGDVAVAGRVPGVLTGVGERVELGVAVHRAVGSGQDQGVRGEAAAGAQHGKRAAHPDAVLGRLVDEETGAGTVDRLGDPVALHGEPGREHLGQHDKPGPGAGRLGDPGRQAGEVGGRILPDDVVLDGGDPHPRTRDPPGPAQPACDRPASDRSLCSRSTASSSTSSRLQKAKRTSDRPAATSS